MANTGIILRKDIKNNLSGDFSPVDGEIVFAQDTNEIGMKVGEEIIWQDWSSASDVPFLLTGTEVPLNSDFSNGDKFIRVSGGVVTEYKKEAGVWRELQQGALASWVEANLEIDNHNASDYPYLGKYSLKMVDGYIPTLALEVATKGYLQSLPGVAGYIHLNGDDSMDNGYFPTLDGDLVTANNMLNGDFEIVIPTSQPPIDGALWNDGGVLRISSVGGGG